MEMYAFLLRPGLAALDNLADTFVAGWLLPSKVLDLSYPTPPLPPLVFVIQSDEGRQLAGKSTASRRRYRGQDSILIILEYQLIITVEKLQLWCTNSGCNTRYSKILFTVVVESNAESIHQALPEMQYIFRSSRGNPFTYVIRKISYCIRIVIEVLRMGYFPDISVWQQPCSRAAMYSGD